MPSASRYVTHFWKPGVGGRGGLASGELILPHYTKTASPAGRGCGCDLAAAAGGWWEVWRLCFAGGCKITWWAEVCVGCQRSRSFYLASPHAPVVIGGLLAYIWIDVQQALSYYLEDLKRLRMEGAELYILCYILKPVDSSGFLSLDALPSYPPTTWIIWGRIFGLAVNS